MIISRIKNISNNKIGAILVTQSTILGVVQGVLTKSLSGLHPAQVLFLKSFIGLGCVLLFMSMVYPEKLNKLKVYDKTGHVIKAVAGAVGNIFWISSLFFLNVTDCVTLSMTSAIFNSIGGVVFFAERPKKTIWLALLMCSIGVFVITGFLNLGLVSTFGGGVYFLLPLVSAVFFSISSLSVKRLKQRNNSSESILVVLMSLMSIISLPFAVYFWRWMSVKEVITIFIISTLYQLSHYIVIKAYSIADASYIAPFKYNRFPAAIIIGYFVLGDVVSINSLVGGVIIIMSGYLVLSSDHEKGKALS